MFSTVYCQEIKGYFEERMALLRDRERELEAAEEREPGKGGGLYGCSLTLLRQKREEIGRVLEQCSQDEREAMWFLYSASPLSDMLDHPAALFLAYAKHGVFLWKEGPFAGKVPEKIFANYVLHHRVHNEDLADTRRFFYDQLAGRTGGKGMYEAVVEANYWCGEHATYQSTYMRTQNPMTMYGTAAGRCGEEAPFAATALRSIGIPAREVYAPWWAHCDDNHAWIEAWCDGKWYFTGGCEPEEQLNEGWFVGPCSRAMLISSRWFGKDAPIEPVVGHNDLSVGLNHQALYAPSVELTVKVVDEEGEAVPGAKVECCLLNYGKFNPVAVLSTGADPGREDYGMARLDTGYGDLLICASGEKGYGETVAALSRESKKDTPRPGAGGGELEKAGAGCEKKETEAGAGCEDNTGEAGAAVQGRNKPVYTVVLKKELPCTGQWRELELHAPREVLRSEIKTEDQIAAEEAKLAHCAHSRQERMESFYQEREADRVLMRFAEEDKEKIRKILREAKGNMGEIVRFLEWDFAGQTAKLEQQYGQEHWKVEVLEALSPNDYWDIRGEVLADCSICASPYAGSVPREVFFRDLLGPVVGPERARAHRRALLGCLEESWKEQIRKEPANLVEVVEGLVKTYPKEEYANLVISPIGCLTGGMGSDLSRKVLCVNLLRALGIPARLGRMDRTLEYYVDGSFKPLVQGEGEHSGTERDGRLILLSGESLKLSDWKHYSLSRFEKGHFTPLFLGAKLFAGRKRRSEDRQKESGKEREIDRLELVMAEGVYRIVTTNRLRNGGQLVKILDFSLESGEEKEIQLSMQEISEEEMLDRVPVEDLKLDTEEGEQVMVSSLTGEKRALVLWLDLGREPSEHILNELYEKRNLYGEIPGPVYFVVRQGKNYREDPTLGRTSEGLPKARILLHDFGSSYEAFSCQVGRNPGKLPLAAVMEQGAEGLECIWSDAGYNVGMADTLLQILQGKEDGKREAAREPAAGKP